MEFAHPTNGIKHCKESAAACAWGMTGTSISHANRQRLSRCRASFCIAAMVIGATLDIGWPSGEGLTWDSRPGQASLHTGKAVLACDRLILSLHRIGGWASGIRGCKIVNLEHLTGKLTIPQHLYDKQSSSGPSDASARSNPETACIASF